MTKWFLRIFAVCVISIFAGSLGISFSKDFFNTMFNVLGIMFSVALGQVLSFSFSNITNEDFVLQHRNQLSKIQNIFIFLFSLSAVFFFLSEKEIPININIVKFSANCFFGCFDIFCLIYFIINFIGLVKLKSEIDDLIRKS